MMRSRWGTDGSMAALMAGRHDGLVGFRLTREDLLRAVRESSGRRKPPPRSRTAAAASRSLQAGPANLLPEDWEVFGCLAALREDDGDDDMAAVDASGKPARPASAAGPSMARAFAGGAWQRPHPSSAPAWKQPAPSPLLPGGEEPWYGRLAHTPRHKVKPKRRAAAAASVPWEPGRCSSEELRLRQRPRSTLARSHPLLPPPLAGPAPAAKPRQRRAPADERADGREPPVPIRRLRRPVSAAACVQHYSSRASRPESPPKRTRRTRLTGDIGFVPCETDLPATGGGLDDGEGEAHAQGAESDLRRLEGELDAALRELIACTGEETPQLLLHTLQRISARGRASANAAEPTGQHGAAQADAESAVDRALSHLARQSGQRAHQLLLRSIRRVGRPSAVPAAATAPPAGEAQLRVAPPCQLRVAPPCPRPGSALRVNDRPPSRHGQSIQGVEKPVLYGEVAYPRRRSAAALSSES